MADGRLEFDFVADTTSFDRGVRRVEGSLTGLQKAGRAAGVALAGLFVAREFAQQFGQIARSIDRYAAAADRAEKTTLLFRRQLERTGDSIGTGVGLVRDLSNTFGTLAAPVEDAATILSRAGASVDQIGPLLESAGASALAIGRDVETGFENVARAVATGRSELLDTVGIITNLGPATQDYAESIGKTVDELTEQEVLQARINAIIEETRSEVEDLDTLTSGLAGTNQRLTSSTRDARQEIGEFFTPAVIAAKEATITATSAIADFFRRLNETPFDQVEQNLDDLRVAIAGSDSPKEALESVVEILDGDLREKGVSALADVEAGVRGVGEALDELAFEQILRALDPAFEAAEKAVQRFIQVSFGPEGFGGLPGEIAASLGNLDLLLEQQAFGPARVVIDQIIDELDRLENVGRGAEGQAVRALAGSLRQLREGILEAQEATADLATVEGRARERGGRPTEEEPGEEGPTEEELAAARERRAAAEEARAAAEAQRRANEEAIAAAKANLSTATNFADVIRTGVIEPLDAALEENFGRLLEGATVLGDAAAELPGQRQGGPGGASGGAVLPPELAAGLAAANRSANEATFELTRALDGFSTTTRETETEVVALTAAEVAEQRAARERARAARESEEAARAAADASDAAGIAFRAQGRTTAEAAVAADDAARAANQQANATTFAAVRAAALAERIDDSRAALARITGSFAAIGGGRFVGGTDFGRAGTTGRQGGGGQALTAGANTAADRLTRAIVEALELDLERVRAATARAEVGLERLANVGISAARKIPLLGDAILGLVQGGPLGALAAVLESLLGPLLENERVQEGLAQVAALLQQVIEPLVPIFAALLEAIAPVLRLVGGLVAALAPLVDIIVRILAPVLGFLARLVATVANFFIRIANLFGAGIDLIDTTGGLPPAPETEETGDDQGAGGNEPRFDPRTPRRPRPAIALEVPRSSAQPVISSASISAARTLQTAADTLLGAATIFREAVESDNFQAANAAR